MTKSQLYQPASVMFQKTLEDMEEVIHEGGRKYGYPSWMDPDNPSLEHVSNHASMCRHLAEFYVGIEVDHESGLDPLLHLAWRALAAYERKIRGINQTRPLKRDDDDA